MNGKVYEDCTKAAKIPIMLYDANLNGNILWIHLSQKWHQRSVNYNWSCIVGNLSGDWLRPLLNGVLAGLFGKRVSNMLPAPF
jgi:hypothetical protein